MKKYNFKETYLIEGFFDDLEDDLDTSDTVVNSISDITQKTLISTIKNKFNNIFFEYEPSIDLSFNIDGNILIIDYRVPEYELNNNVHVNQITEFFKYLYNEVKIREIKSNLSFFIKGAQLFELDFFNIKISCSRLSLYRIQPKNLQYYNKEGIIQLSYCNLIYSNTIKIYTNELYIDTCANMQDYSFIKYINLQLRITGKDDTYFAKTHNLTGLPKGDYVLEININDIKQLFTLEGIPDTLLYGVINLRLVDDSNLDYIMSNLSFMGINTKLDDKIDLTIVFPQYYEKLNWYIGSDKRVSIGNYRVNIALTKDNIKYMMNNNDYIIKIEIEK